MSVPIGSRWLEGDLESPLTPHTFVLFAHGKQSRRGDHVTHTIHLPTHVFIDKIETGANTALKTDSADGTKAVLRLRTTALLETVAGVLLG